MSKLCTNLDEYLKRNMANKSEFTHTRIGNKELKINGGIYNIKDINTFRENYYKHVFVNGNREYLTEKQNPIIGPLVVDIDMRYSTDIKSRQHGKNHIIDAIDIYGKKIGEMFDIPDKFKIEIFVMEKSEVNKLENKTKDGIHIIFGALVDRAAQIVLREKVLTDIKEAWEDLPFTNSVDELIDEGITRGTVNWQLYGSRKPNNKAYLIKYHLNITWSKEREAWSFTENNIEKFDTKNQLHKLSVQCVDFPKIEVNKSMELEIEKIKEYIGKKQKKTKEIVIKNSMRINDIKTIENLDECVADMLREFEENSRDYELRETHNFTMILPKSYWEEGSYNKWIRVGWALKNTSQKLLPTWIKFCSQAKNFKINEIDELVRYWESFNYENQDGLTNRSIMYWAKIDNPKEYKEIQQETLSHYIELTIESNSGPTEWDLARVLYQICKDEFVCVSIKNNIWYEYFNHRWYEIDSGNSLRSKISKDMHDSYMKKTVDGQAKLNTIEQTDESYDPMRNRINKLSNICLLLKKTNWKNNIMREAKELFYDNNFLNKIDSNAYLLCFNNYVIDFKNQVHRKGKPDDYISKSTNIDYKPLGECDLKIRDEINQFMEQLFPHKELRDYMWEHLASTLIGNNDNQTFNIYTGDGRNGKSKLIDLMSRTLGDYKATIPITLVTQKRNAIGSTSSEIVQLMGIRYAVMQEPSKGEVINEGIMKEITGGDPIQGRALFKEAVTFIPQFKLVVCTNTLFDIKSNDDGTWRRIRVCDFVAKFLDKPYEDEVKFAKKDYPYQYKIDKNIDEKFKDWAPVLASMLVDIIYKTNGIVKDCEMVLTSSDNYRQDQDYLTEFCRENIKAYAGGCVKKATLWEQFKTWYMINYGRVGLPKARELNEYMDKKYGKYDKKWKNITLISDIDDD